jgi:septal ring factor EnvC (AmiA/AmiB activator)
MYKRCQNWANNLSTREPRSLPEVSNYVIDGMTQMDQNFTPSRVAANAAYTAVDNLLATQRLKARTSRAKAKRKRELGKKVLTTLVRGKNVLNKLRANVARRKAERAALAAAAAAAAPVAAVRRSARARRPRT